MSLPYGLRASLMAIKRELRQALAAAGHTAFRRIALIEENGHLLLAVGATEHAAAQTYAVQDTARAGPLEVRRSAHGNRLTLSLPVTAEGHSLGFLAADIDAADLLTRHAGDLTDGPGASALLGPEGEILGGRLKPVPTTWPDGAGLPDRGPIRVAVGDSGLHLIADPASPADFFASPMFLIALGLLAIPLLVAIAYVNRLTRRLLGLQDRFDAMRQQQVLIGQQNERLQREIDQRVKSEQKLAHQANYDQLTGLPNRNLAIDRLSQAIKWAKREGGRVLTLFLDLDRFKQVNDTHGHPAGATATPYRDWAVTSSW